MEPVKPFFRLKHRIADQAESHVKNLVMIQIALAASVGTAVFFLAGLAFWGSIDLLPFTIAGVFLVALQVIFCWMLSFLYKLQEKIRLLRVVSSAIYLSVLGAAFISLQFSPLLPPPRFLA